MAIKKLYWHKYHFPNTQYDIDRPEERAKLDQRCKIYWMALGQGRHIGYYKGKTCNTWTARIRLLNRNYKTRPLGLADDGPAPDGVPKLSYERALSLAKEWFGLHADQAVDPEMPIPYHVEIIRPPDNGVYTVAHATADYFEWKIKHRIEVRSGVNGANVHLLPALGHIPLSELRTSDIVRWFEALPFKPCRIRSPKGEPPRYLAPPKTDEELRRRKVSANTQLRLLKAVLRRAYLHGLCDDSNVWQRVRPYSRVQRHMPKILTKDECIALVRAAESDICALIKGALFTGCRKGELLKMQVGDYWAQTEKIIIRKTKGGGQRVVALTPDGAQFFEELTRSRNATDFMFVRDEGRPWWGALVYRHLHAACRAAEIDPPIGFHALRHTYASHSLMSGMSLEALARQLGHRRIKTMEMYYLHVTETFVDKQVREFVPNLVGEINY